MGQKFVRQIWRKLCLMMNILSDTSFYLTNILSNIFVQMLGNNWIKFTKIWISDKYFVWNSFVWRNFVHKKSSMGFHQLKLWWLLKDLKSSNMYAEKVQPENKSLAIIASKSSMIKYLDISTTFLQGGLVNRDICMCRHTQRGCNWQILEVAKVSIWLERCQPKLVASSAVTKTVPL